jgi:hypothetical protein
MFWRKVNLRAVGQLCERSDVGLQYKVYTEREFDRELAIKNGMLLMHHCLSLIKLCFRQFPKSQEIPMQLDYCMGMLARQMLVWALFRYCNPSEIMLDYLHLLQTDHAHSFLQLFICPCGNTLALWDLHWNLLRRKEGAEHKWTRTGSPRPKTLAAR